MYLAKKIVGQFCKRTRYGAVFVQRDCLGCVGEEERRQCDGTYYCCRNWALFDHETDELVKYEDFTREFADTDLLYEKLFENTSNYVCMEKSCFLEAIEDHPNELQQNHNNMRELLMDYGSRQFKKSDYVFATVWLDRVQYQLPNSDLPKKLTEKMIENWNISHCMSIVQDYYARSEWENVLVAQNRLNELAPNVKFLQGTFQMLQNLGLPDLEGAIDCLEKALEINPIHESSLEMLGNFLLMNPDDTERADQHIRRMEENLDVFSDQCKAYTKIYRSKIHQVNDENEKASEFAVEAVRICPDLQLGLLQQATTVIRSQDKEHYETAAKGLRRLNNIRGDVQCDPEIYTLLVELYNRGHMYEEAVKVVDEVLRFCEEGVFVGDEILIYLYRNRVLANTWLYEYDEAIKDCEKILDHEILEDGILLGVLFDRGWCYVQTERYEEAKEDLQSYLLLGEKVRESGGLEHFGADRAKELLEAIEALEKYESKHFVLQNCNKYRTYTTQILFSWNQSVARNLCPPNSSNVHEAYAFFSF